MKNEGHIRKTLYIPIEIKARELASQLLLASTVVRAGGRVYIGSKAAVLEMISLKKGAHGVLLYKGGFPGGFKNIKKKLDAIAILDQEISPALVNMSVVTSRFGKEEVQYIDRYYFVLKKFADIFSQELPTEKEKVRVFGWPRVDLWSQKFNFFWEPEASRILSTYGEFILFSSDFGVIHHEDIDVRIKQQLAWDKKVGVISDISSLRGRLEKCVKDFHVMVDFLSDLDSDPNIPKIIVRPHPSENHEVWIKSLFKLKKTKVVFKGDITPWLLASRALLHRGCTTAIQAVVSKKRVGAIIAPSEKFAYTGPAIEVSKKLYTPRDVRNFVKQNDKHELTDLPVELGSLMAGDAAEQIGLDLLTLVGSGEPRFVQKYMSYARFRLKSDSIFQRILNINRTESQSLKNGLPQLPLRISSNKLPGGVNEAEIRELLARLQSSEINVRQVMKDCIELDM